MPTNISEHDIALRPVQAVRVKNIRPAGRENVYNMEVTQHHNFSVNGGVIVHNCMDETRYFCYTILNNEGKWLFA